MHMVDAYCRNGIHSKRTEFSHEGQTFPEEYAPVAPPLPMHPVLVVMRNYSFMSAFMSVREQLLKKLE